METGLPLLDELREALVAHRSDEIEGDYPDAAVLMAFTDEPEPELVLTVRSSQLSSHAGEVAFPGGKRDETDESLLYTALRETEEEIALDTSLVEVLGRSRQRISYWGLRVTPFVGIIPRGMRLEANPFEIAEIFHVPLKFLLDRNNLAMDSIIRDGEPRSIPNYPFQGYSVWGLTAVMIIDLLNTVYDYGVDLER